MKYPTLLLGLMTLMASTVTATAHKAADVSGNYWLPYCESRSRNDDFMNGACMGIIDAVVSTNEFMRPEYRFCLTGGISREQGLRVVIKFLKDNPQILDRPF